MNKAQHDEATPLIVNAQGQPARKAAAALCPHCGAGPDRRGPSSGFGQAMTICLKCGHDFQEVWRG
jgi:uncharacterized protein (DUF983 family)